MYRKWLVFFRKRKCQTVLFFERSCQTVLDKVKPESMFEALSVSRNFFKLLVYIVLNVFGARTVSIESSIYIQLSNFV